MYINYIKYVWIAGSMHSILQNTWVSHASNKSHSGSGLSFSYLQYIIKHEVYINLSPSPYKDVV